MSQANNNQPVDNSPRQVQIKATDKILQNIMSVSNTKNIKLITIILGVLCFLYLLKRFAAVLILLLVLLFFSHGSSSDQKKPVSFEEEPNELPSVDK